MPSPPRQAAAGRRARRTAPPSARRWRRSDTRATFSSAAAPNRRRRLSSSIRRAERVDEEAGAAVRDHVPVDAVGDDVPRPGRAVVGHDGQPDGHRLEEHHREALVPRREARTPRRSRARRASAGSGRTSRRSRGHRACRSAPPARVRRWPVPKIFNRQSGNFGASRAQASSSRSNPLRRVNAPAATTTGASRAARCPDVRWTPRWGCTRLDRADPSAPDSRRRCPP